MLGLVAGAKKMLAEIIKFQVESRRPPDKKKRAR